MPTTIQVSDTIRKKLKILASHRDISYNEFLEELITVFEAATPFQNEEEFAAWFEDNLEKFGFEDVVERRKRASPDYQLRDTEGNIREVELEMVGKNFISHGHDPKKTDLIICLFSEEDTISGVPVIPLTSSEELKDQVYDKPQPTGHTTLTIPKPLQKAVSQYIEDTGFQNVSEFTRFLLRDIAAQGSFDGPEEYTETVEKVRERLRNLGYPPHDEEDAQ